jgi:hypothetical protein
MVRIIADSCSVVPGERIVETYIYAGGIRSDQARSFIQVRPEIGSEAGPDLEVVP